MNLDTKQAESQAGPVQTLELTMRVGPNAASYEPWPMRFAVLIKWFSSVRV